MKLVKLYLMLEKGELINVFIDYIKVKKKNTNN